jgi:hypothetical protein
MMLGPDGYQMLGYFAKHDSMMLGPSCKQDLMMLGPAAQQDPPLLGIAVNKTQQLCRRIQLWWVLSIAVSRIQQLCQTQVYWAWVWVPTTMGLAEARLGPSGAQLLPGPSSGGPCSHQNPVGLAEFVSFEIQPAIELEETGRPGKNPIESLFFAPS